MTVALTTSSAVVKPANTLRMPSSRRVRMPISRAVARSTLEACGYKVKLAIVMIERKLSLEQAQARLDACDGSVRKALA